MADERIDIDTKEYAIGILSRPFEGCGPISHCGAHMKLIITERPDDCRLCLVDLRNHMRRAILVNQFLNAKVDEALDALRDSQG